MRPSTLILLAVASCDSHSAESTKPPAAVAPVAVVAPAATAASAVGRVGEPFGCLSGLSIEMTFDQAAHAAPGLEPSKNPSGRILTSYAQSCAAWVQFIGDRIDDIKMPLPEGMNARLTAAWGPGIPGTDDAGGLGAVGVYFNQAGTIRAEVGQQMARFEPMMPLARLLGASPALTVMGIPILGRPLSEVDAAFAARFIPDGVFDKPAQKTRRLPANEWSQRPEVTYSADAHGVIDAVKLYMFFNLPGGEEALREALADRFGRPRDGVYAIAGGRGKLTFGDHRATLAISAH
jgi:hypothetical protein